MQKLNDHLKVRAIPPFANLVLFVYNYYENELKCINNLYNNIIYK